MKPIRSASVLVAALVIGALAVMASALPFAQTQPTQPQAASQPAQGKLGGNNWKPVFYPPYDGQPGQVIERGNDNFRMATGFGATPEYYGPWVIVLVPARNWVQDASGEWYPVDVLTPGPKVPDGPAIPTGR